MSMKNPLTPAGIKPATFRFVAQHNIQVYTKEKYGKVRMIKQWRALVDAVMNFRVAKNDGNVLS